MSRWTNKFKQLGRKLVRGDNGHDLPWRQSKNQALISNLPNVVFQLDEGGRWAYLNPAWTGLTGYSLDSSIGKNHRHYFHPTDCDLIEEHLSRIARQPRAIGPITVRLLRKDGKSRWVAMHVRPIVRDRNTSNHIVGTLTDITQQIHVEEIRQAKQRNLENLTANLPGMLYRCRNDRDWTMEYVSEGCVALTGFRPEDIVRNRKTTWANVIHPDDRDRIWDEVQYSLQRTELFELLYRIVTASGDVKWVLERGQGNFADSGQLLGIEGFIADITQKKIAEDRLHRAALYDAETSLPNTTLFVDRLQFAIEKRQAHDSNSFALLLISIDQYQDIVESQGAGHGVQIMARISRRLQEELRRYHSICLLRDNRLGVLLDGVTVIKDVTTLLQRIQEQVQAPIDVEGSDFYTTASVGVALSDKAYKHSDNMMADANTALSRAKALGGARYEISDLHIHAKAASQSQMEVELQQAMDKDEFRLFWQPVVRARDGRLAGLEAKMGWLHRRRGLLFADSFVSYAKEPQLITPLWEWMLTEARLQTDVWQDLKGIADTALTVQISGNTLLDAESILRLGKKLLAAKLPPFSLAIGVPVHVLTQTPRTVQRMLRRLTARNIQLILEAFGTGNVTLSIMQKMPIDTIRLDRELVAEAVSDGGRYIAALMAFVRKLGITVIADGVETERELAVLQAVDVDYVQGNLISAPVDAEAAQNMLEHIDQQWFSESPSDSLRDPDATSKVVIQMGH